MEEGAKSSRYIILFLVVFEEEVADRMLTSISKLVVDKRFGEDRLAAARIRRDPEQIIVWFVVPLEILGMGYHPFASAVHSRRIDILELLVCACFERLMAVSILTASVASLFLQSPLLCFVQYILLYL